MNIEDFELENSHNEWSWIWNSIIILYTQVPLREFQNGLCFDMYDTFSWNILDRRLCPWIIYWSNAFIESKLN